MKRVYGKDFSTEAVDAKMLQLLEAISHTYDETEKEKHHLEHTIDVHFEEIREAGKKIEAKNQELETLLKERSDLLDLSQQEHYAVSNLLHQYKRAIDEVLLVSMTDKSGVITYANQRFSEVSGYTREELIGKPHNIVRHPSVKPEVFRQMWETIKAKKMWFGTIPNARKDGSSYYVNTTIVPLLDARGEIEEYIALRVDVTEQIGYQERITKILDNQESIVLLSDKDDGVIQVNRKFFEAFHFESMDAFKKEHQCICELFEDEEGFVKRPPEGVYWVEDLLKDPRKLYRVKILGRIYSVKVSEINLDAKIIHLSSFSDITEYEQARQDAFKAERAKADFLANMSHEIRTPMNGVMGFMQLLANTELDEKQRRYLELMQNSGTTLLEIINDILDFSKIESGEIESETLQINPFQEFEQAFLLLSQKALEEGISYLVTIDSHISECITVDAFHIKQVMFNLIGNAIKFTPEGGTVHVSLERISVMRNRERIRFSVRDSGIGIPKERQEKIFKPFSQADSSTTRKFGGTGLGLSISTSLVQAMGGELQLESEEGKGSCFYFELDVVSCIPKERLSEHLLPFHLRVIDTGSPYHDKIIHQLDDFGVPYQVQSAEDEYRYGDEDLLITTDWELASHHKDVHLIYIGAEPCEPLHEGMTCIDTYGNCPSTFYNTLLGLEMIPLCKIEHHHFKNRYDIKVLVAEDYEVNRVLIDELLSGFGVDFTFAVNGEEALQKVEEEDFDLIFMDINMPVMNGIDATRHIREVLKRRTPIVALTANALKGDRERFLEAGMNEHITKPIDVDTLERVLRLYAKGSHTVHKEEDGLELLGTDSIAASLKESAEAMHFSPAIIIRLLKSFVDGSRESIKKLEEAVNKHDYGGIEYAAHDIKGTAATLHFNRLADTAKEMEYHAKKGENADYPELFHVIRSMVDEVAAYYFEQYD